MRTTHFIRICAALTLAITANCAATADAASQQLVSMLLSNNARWLKPDVKKLSYTFHMQHSNRDDLYEVQIDYASPGNLNVLRDGEERGHEIDNAYDPNNSAFPPRLLTILQGVTMFGPMQELALVPEDFQLVEIDGVLEGHPEAQAMKLLPTGQPSQKALAKWEEKISEHSFAAEHWYVLTPVIENHEGESRAVIRIESLFEKGPAWEGIQVRLRANPTSFVWERIFNSVQYPEEYHALLVPAESGMAPFLLRTSGKSGEFIPSALIREGERVPNETIHGILGEVWPRPERLIAMRVGCGVWGCWYGYSGGGAFEDRIWIDESTGVVLREEGFDENGGVRFTIDYSEFETLADREQVPLHVVVTLPDDESPWIFDMRFSTHGGAVWLLDKLTEYQGDEEVATAWISDVAVE